MKKEPVRITSESVQHKKRRQFLTAFRQTGNIARAAEAAAVGRQTHYDWLHSDPEYAQQFEDARQEAADRVEAEIWRRGVEGVQEPVFYQGEVCGHIRRYSDTLLIVTAKALRPEKFRDNYAVEARLAQLEAAFAELVQHTIANRNGSGPVVDRLRTAR